LKKESLKEESLKEELSKEDLIKETALIEAILYMESDPIDEAGLSRISGFSREMVKETLERLDERYAQENSGLELFHIGSSVQITPKREYWENLKDRYGKKNDGKISRAAMETLSIIAYAQPVTRAEIKGYRGVNPDTMMHLLHEKGLIREVGKKDVPGKPVQYGTTREFLRQFRLGSIADLPKLNEKDLDRFELEGEN